MRACLVVVLALLASTVVVVAPAAAVPGLVRRESLPEAANSTWYRQAWANCPSSGYRVVGAGAELIGAGNQVRLTTVHPFTSDTGGSVFVRAEEFDTGFAGNWRLMAYAICAPVGSVPGYQIVSGKTPDTSTVFQQATARCPGTKRVIGVGGGILHANGQVGLQLLRPANPLDISRATAREDADGYAANWSVTSYAICADRIESAAVYGQVADGSGAQANCPPDKKLHSGGGGGGLTDSGPVWLDLLYPFDNMRTWWVAMTGTPTGGLSVGALCAF